MGPVDTLEIIQRPVFFLLLCEMTFAGTLGLGLSPCRRPVHRLAILAALTGTALLFDAVFVDTSNASTILESPLCILAVFLYLLLALRLDGKDAAYCTVWAFLIGELLAQIIFPCASILSHSVDHWLMVRLITLLIYGLAAAGGRFCIQKWLVPELRNDGGYSLTRRKLIFCLTVVAIFLFASNYQLIVWLMGYSPEGASPIITFFRLAVELICLFLLFLQNSIDNKRTAEKELAIQEQLWRQRQSQFQMTQENIALINRKCHDLKHQIEAIRQMQDRREIDRQMEEMERAVLLYDSAIRTGDEALDVILTEKNLHCEAAQITMTCMAEGRSLGFINKVDLYTMFGNALDNAIESVSGLDNPDKRIIQIAIYTEGALLMIRVRNYFEGTLEFENNLPVTTKEEKGYHGYGLKSIRYTAEKYGGTVTVQAKDHYFTLQILIPYAGDADKKF